MSQNKTLAAELQYLRTTDSYSRTYIKSLNNRLPQQNLMSQNNRLPQQNLHNVSEQQTPTAEPT